MDLTLPKTQTNQKVEERPENDDDELLTLGLTVKKDANQLVVEKPVRDEQSNLDQTVNKNLNYLDKEFQQTLKMADEIFSDFFTLKK